MDFNSLRWIFLVTILCLSTFGASCCLIFVVAVLMFIIGFTGLLYIGNGNSETYFQQCAGIPQSKSQLKLTTQMKKQEQELAKIDGRVTGSELIDNSLQEILGHIIRDYILPWYSLISAHEEFSEAIVRQTIQTVAINISNKVKEVDWIPFLTTRLVDDAASHLRLFKQARSKFEQVNKVKTAQNSPARHPTHKRNKSEADIMNCGASKFYLLNNSIKSGLEDYFFELECEMEKGLICRDAVCVDVTQEKQFLSELVEIFLYVLLPDADFQCIALRLIIREIVANCVMLPLFTLASDPDFVNQAIITLCLRAVTAHSDIFLTVLRLTDDCEELLQTREMVAYEMQQLRSRDFSCENDISIKQQISSLSYVTKLIDTRLSNLSKLCNESNQSNYMKLENLQKIKLPLEVILKNNVALSYFIDYVSGINQQAYLFLYLNIEGWKISTEQQLSDNAYDESNIRSTALSIYEQYLGKDSEQGIVLDWTLVQILLHRVNNLSTVPSELWFDEIQSVLYEKLENQKEFLPNFQRSTAYIKLLADLDLLQHTVAEEDANSFCSSEGDEEDKVLNHKQLKDTFLTAPKGAVCKHIRSLSDVPTIRADKELGDSKLSVKIIETGVVCDKGKTFGVYALHVQCCYAGGYLKDWHVYRRYSDFYDLHTKIKNKYSDLGKLPFPGKKTFHNMDRAVLERRMRMLNVYLMQLCEKQNLSVYPNLGDLLLGFLEQGEYDRATSGGPIDTIRSGMKTIKNMPEQLINTVDEVVEGISKALYGKNIGKITEASSKVGAGIDIECDDNIPLRIMLLLMDEVFDLKSKNQWLRRRIVTLLRQIVRMMFGDIVNRRILDYVSYMTSPKNVAHYLLLLKNSLWPNGVKAESNSERDSAIRGRTRVAAKVALLTSLSDELKHIIGSETTRRGLLTVFELLQHPVLNRRLIYVVLQGFLESLFPDKNIALIFEQLHSKRSKEQLSWTIVPTNYFCMFSAAQTMGVKVKISGKEVFLSF